VAREYFWHTLARIATELQVRQSFRATFKHTPAPPSPSQTAKRLLCFFVAFEQATTLLPLPHGGSTQSL
jgi:hypothetical protein